MEKKNNLNTKFLPSIFMLTAALIAYVFCYIRQYEMSKFLLIVFASMLVFAILGTIVKTIMDSFNMRNSYEDFSEEGEVYEKDDE